MFDFLNDIAEGVSKTINDVGRVFKGMGPAGTIALMIAMPAFAAYMAAGSPMVAAAGSEAALAAGATSGAAAGSAAGVGIAEGVGAAVGEGVGAGLGATISEAAALEGYSAAVSSGALSLGEATTAYTNAYYGFSDLVAPTTAETLGIELAPATADYSLAAQPIGTVTAEGAMADPALGISAKDLYASPALGEAKAASSGFDWNKAAQAAKSLLSAGGAMDLQLPSAPAIPALNSMGATKSISAGQGGGLGLSNYAAEANPTAVAIARNQEEKYKSLLARGYK